MAVNDANVSAIVARALANPGDADMCCGKVGIGFRALQAARQVPGASLDMDLAAAEHYLFARWMVCTGTVSPTQMKALVVGYDVKKWIDKFRGKPNATAVTTNPVSPPDSGVVRWGLKGATEGTADHDRCNAKMKPPIWRKLEEVFGPGRGVGPY